MTPSPDCAALVQRFEQCRLHAYRPTPNDVWTCGWGATGPDIGPTTVWTQKYADQRFDADLTERGEQVTAMLGEATATQNQFDALCSFDYNEGSRHLAFSTLLRNHRLGLYNLAAEEFGKWVYQDGVILPGLVTRRAAEETMYRGVM